MLIYEIIDKKRRNEKLLKKEIEWVVENYVSGNVLEEQMSSLLMAICINGMDFKEAYYLTKAMQATGKTYSFDFDIVDKHSTGGVSDSTTLILTPILALAGLKVAKMSGRSLGTTGGTIDKLSVFDNYKFNVEEDEFKKIIQTVGASIISQKNDIALGDKKIYALRDKTATVKSIPLIASSIMSKKLACGAKVLLLDVKYGKGALMKNKKDALELAKTMVKIGNMNGTKTWAVLTNMNTPLADGVGSAMEVYSAIDAINGKKSYLREISAELATYLYQMSKNCSYLSAKKVISQILKNPNAIMAKLQEMISAHGGNCEYLMHPENLINAKNYYELKASKEGFVTEIDALDVARFVMLLEDRAGVERKLFQGVLLNVALNTKVSKGDTLVKIYCDGELTDDEVASLEKAIIISPKKINIEPLIYKVVRSVK